MGGKYWSQEEEDYFWRVAIASSPKRIGVDRARPEKPWPDLAEDMQRALGEGARRQYTGLMLFEHWFQNIITGRVSPNAGLHVYEYNQRRGPEDNIDDGPGPKSRRPGARRQAREASAPSAPTPANTETPPSQQAPTPGPNTAYHQPSPYQGGIPDDTLGSAQARLQSGPSMTPTPYVPSQGNYSAQAPTGYNPTSYGANQMPDGSSGMGGGGALDPSVNSYWPAQYQSPTDTNPILDAGFYSVRDQHYSQGYGQNPGQYQDQRYNQSSGQHYGQNFGQNFGQHYGQNYGQNHNQHQSQNYGRTDENHGQNHNLQYGHNPTGQGYSAHDRTPYYQPAHDPMINGQHHVPESEINVGLEHYRPATEGHFDDEEESLMVED